MTFPTKVAYDKHMKFRLNPTVREVNRYLSPLIEQLTEKHVKVSNPEFEDELKQLTGIGWKQAKNYKNHPKPGQRLNDNAQITEFVFQCRKTDKKRTAIIYLAGMAFAILAIFFCIELYSIMTKERILIFKQPVGNIQKSVDPKNVTPTFSLKIPSHGLKLKLGSATNQNLDLSKISCNFSTKTLQACTHETTSEGAVLSTVIYIDEGIVKTIMITAVGKGSHYLTEVIQIIRSLKVLNTLLDKSLTLIHPTDKFNFEKNHERITVTTTSREGDKSISSIQIILELLI